MRNKRPNPPASATESWPTSTRKKVKKAKLLEYQPLDPTKHQIRLLELFPGKSGSRIFGRLFPVSLDDTPRFDALSYTWGPPQPSYTISIATNYSLSVGRNLRKALDDIRWEDEPRLIWTDAICINQSDMGEKEHQIRLMRTIYASARVVCAWIDHNVQPMGDVFNDLASLGKGVEIADFYDPAYWYPVADILRNPYWGRLWIQQELILAPKIEIYCRRDVLDGQQILEFQHRVNAVNSQVTPVDGPVRKLFRYMNKNSGQPSSKEALSGGILQAKANMLKGREIHSKGHDETEILKITLGNLGSSLLHLFTESVGLSMTDPRDRVYGMLGLVTDIDESALVIDYSASVVSVYSQVFQLYANHYKSLNFLCFHRERSSSQYPRRDDFPTWMPHANINWSYVNASKACGATLAKHVLIQPESFAMSIEGILVDTIWFVGDREALQVLPVPVFLSRVEGYCRKLWPDATDYPLHERESVTALFFSWLSKKRYRAMWNLDKPDPGQRVALIHSISAAADKADQKSFSFQNVVYGGYTPYDIISSKDRESTLPLSTNLGGTVFVGTEKGQLGSMDMQVSVQAGDQVWIILGCRMPMILRPIPSQAGRFTVVGPAIFPDLMRGEAVDALPTSEIGQSSNAPGPQISKIELI